MQICVRDSHAYPGCRATLPEPRPETPVDVVVRFADGVEVPGRLSPSAGGLRLEIAVSRTAAGTSIMRKLWELRQDRAGWKVRARLADPA